jgi:hypothetical protein
MAAALLRLHCQENGAVCYLQVPHPLEVDVEAREVRQEEIPHLVLPARVAVKMAEQVKMQADGR